LTGVLPHRHAPNHLTEETVMTFARIVRRVAVLGALVAAALSANTTTAHAKPPFSAKEKVACNYCHTANNGGARNFRGLFYDANKLSFDKFDNDYEAKKAGVDPKAVGADAAAKNPDYPKKIKAPEALSFVLKDIEGKPKNLARYEGKVVLLVNVASKCGNTPQYADLQKLYDKYKSKGLVILGVPSNDFGMQEPGTEKDIKQFCTDNYKVSFPMFSKVVVKGEDQIPLYKLITDKEKYPKTGGEVRWNFDKFLYNSKGEVVGRFDPMMKPTDPKVVAAIEKELKEVKEEDIEKELKESEKKADGK
jgi:glutathione peroxidase